MRQHAFHALLAGIHHHNGRLNSGLTQSQTFIHIGHPEVIHMVFGQGLCDGHSAKSVGICFDHGHDALARKLGFVMAKVGR